MRVRKFMLDGQFNVTEIALALNVHKMTIYRDMEWVQDEWSRRDARIFDNDGSRRALRVEMLLQSACDAKAGFERSRKNAEVNRTISKLAKCPDCNGKGKSGKSDCVSCDGSGRVRVTEEVHEVKGQAGDPSFLRAYNDSIDKICKIEALYVQKHEVNLNANVVIEEQQKTTMKEIGQELGLDLSTFNRIGTG